MRPQSNSTPWLTLLFALIGLIWCGIVAFPTTSPDPCATSGCALFQDFRVSGISLWWVGGAYFFFLTILCIRGNALAARIFSALALLADCALLIIMFLTAPCFDCLVVAFILCLCYFASRRASQDFFAGDSSRSLLIPLWAGLFLGNVAMAANEQFPHYTIGNEAANTRIYFSPSCPACLEVISSYGNGALLFPVSEQDGDSEGIRRFALFYERTGSAKEAVRHLKQSNEAAPAVGFAERLILEMQLLRNKAALFRQGFRTVPLTQVSGLPRNHKAAHPGQNVAPASQPQNAAPDASGNTPNASDSAPGISGDASATSGQQVSVEIGNAGGGPGSNAPAGQAPEGLSATDGQAPGASGNAAPRASNRQAGDQSFLDLLDGADEFKQCGGNAPQPCD